MNCININGSATAIILLLFMMLPTAMTAQNDFKIVHYTTTDRGKIEAAYFDGKSKQVVIFAHGGVFNKESWYFLAEKLKAKGISSLSIDFRGYGNSKAKDNDQKYLDVSGAIDYVSGMGMSDIYIVGGSMGGAAVLTALDKKEHTNIMKVILLAPAGGPAIKSTSIDKLFIVARGDRFYNGVKEIEEKSSQPKILKVYDGNAHAQHLFKSEHADDLVDRMIEFLTQ